MSEIAFLAQLLLESSINEEIKKKIVDRITEIENLRAFNPIVVPYNTPYIGPIDVCQHDFPQPWYGTVPPNCRKCGQQMYNPLVVTCNDSIRKVE